MSRLLLTLPLLLAACAPAVRGPVTFPDVQATLPAPPDPAQLRVLIMGDQGKGGNLQRQVAQAMQAVCQQQGCDLGVGLGDNFYPQAPKEATDPAFQQRFADLYGPLGIPFLMVAGNHDESWVSGGDGGDPAALRSELDYARLNPQWVMPARSYRARWGQLAEFFVVDTAPLAAYLPVRDPSFRPGGPFDLGQRAWLKTQVLDSDARWNIVLGHHPLLNNGKHGPAGNYDFGLLPWGRGDSVKALYQGVCSHADLIASGHDHTLQLFGPGTAVCPGTPVLVSGAAGEVTGRGVGTTPALFQTFNQPGFFWMQLTATTLELRVYTADAAGGPSLAYTQTFSKAGGR
ncbi:metallophosphoesterase [Deinococcus sonorensis]|uniref:Metallophosphoesterase n=2 Tax=Deinococcus sonorensis TaxID=309891 RepID=A0AAU7UG58_9DEIO